MVFSAGIVRCILNNAPSPSKPLHDPVHKLVRDSKNSRDSDVMSVTISVVFQLATIPSPDKSLGIRVALYIHLQYRYIQI